MKNSLPSTVTTTNTESDRELSSPSTFNDMRLLSEVAEAPHATQRDLAHRIGIALGMTNLMLKRLAKKGFIKITHVQKSRLKYLITTQGIAEKARLTREYIEYSLSFYKYVRIFLKNNLSQVTYRGDRKILLCGTGELAEISFLTIQEMRLELVGVVDDQTGNKYFMEQTVRSLGYAAVVDFDRLIIATSGTHLDMVSKFERLGVPKERILVLPQNLSTLQK